MAEVHMPHAGGDRGAHDDPGGRGRSEHETSDVNLRAILAFGGGLIVACVFINFLVWLLFTYFSARESRQVPAVYPLATRQENRLPPEPRLQTQPREDLRELRAREDEILTSYGWLDKNAGVVRIPIDRAMELQLERGFPTRKEPPKR